MRLILLFLALPLLSVVFYANAFAYAYVVLIPTACLLAGKAFAHFFGAAKGSEATAFAFSGGRHNPFGPDSMDVLARSAVRAEADTGDGARTVSQACSLYRCRGWWRAFPRPIVPIKRSWR